MDKQKMIECVRAFNRFYVVELKFMEHNYLGTGFSVAQMRTLYEIHTQKGITAGDICATLKLDKGYVSRMIKGFEKDGLVTRQVSDEDNRAFCLFLTAEGEKQLQDLIKIAGDDIAGTMETISQQDRDEICAAMQLIMDKFSKYK